MGIQANRRLWILLSLGALLLALMLACQAVVPGETVVERIQSETTAQEVIETETPGVNTSPALTQIQTGDRDEVLVNLYKRVNPAVVNITTYLFDDDDLLVPSGQGSGFVIDKNGNIVTNAHVIHGAEQVEVTFSDGTIRKAEVIGEDLNSDLAVVRIEGLPEGVEPLVLGDMDDLQVGQTVVAIGNPFGLEGTLTVGVISALGRNIPALTPFNIPASIQTDAAINPGNSGGPLLNLAGEVIGVNAQIETGGTSRSNSGVGFAIPVSIVKVVVPDLIETGKHEWAYLGVRGGNLNPILVKAMKLSVEKGAYVAEVLPDGPSVKAGLRGANDTVVVDGRQVEVGGDVLVAVNGQSLQSFDDLLLYIALNARPGDKITLTVLREGKTLDIPVVLGKRPETIDSFTLP